MKRPEIKNSTILVTGGAGFIGSHLVDALQNAGAKQVIIIDNMFLGNEDNIALALKQGAIFYRDDAEFKTSLDYIFNNHKIDIVFNCATKALNYSFLKIFWNYKEPKSFKLCVIFLRPKFMELRCMSQWMKNTQSIQLLRMQQEKLQQI